MGILEKKVSIIIPTFDRPNTLGQVIDSYLCQEGIGELIVIDDGSSKDYTETNIYIKNFIKKFNINYIYHKNERNMGAAFCRNLGVSLANYDYILWGEDDAFLSQKYILTLLNKVNDKMIIFGSIYYGITPSMTETEKINLIKMQQKSEKPIFDMNIFEGYYRKTSTIDIEVPYGHALILVPKKAYVGIKYYENYRINGYREESDAQVQMTEKGYKVIYTSDAECYHLPGNVIENGGQHKNSIIKQEIYKIINTFIFYDRHYKFFKNKYALKSSKFVMKLYFVKHICENIYVRAINKIKRK